MPERSEFEVIIIGGGIAGASLAYFLTERGITDVALLEPRKPARLSPDRSQCRHAGRERSDRAGAATQGDGR